MTDFFDDDSKIDPCFKPIGILVADLDNGECDLLWSYDADHVDAFMMMDVLSDALGMLQRKYEEARKKDLGDRKLHEELRDRNADSEYVRVNLDDDFGESLFRGIHDSLKVIDFMEQKNKESKKGDDK